MEKTFLKVCVTGAAGSIAYSLIPQLVSGHIYGPRTSFHLNLLDVPEKEYALKGLVFELEDSAYPQMTKVEYGSNPLLMFQDCDLVIFLGAASRQPGQERRDLLHVNAKIFKKQGKALNKVAKSDCKCLVVANPCHTNCLVLQKYCPKIPKTNFTSLSRLDHNRAVGQLAVKLGVDIEKISKLTVWGNHSYGTFPDLANSTIEGQKVTELLTLDYIQKDFIDQIQNRALEVHHQRKMPAVVSAARAIANHLRDWAFGTKYDDWISMGVISDGSYGVPEGLVFSFPVTCKNFEFKIVEGLELSDFAKSQLDIAIDEVVDEREEALDEDYDGVEIISN
jgi:malate dehydrogenase